MTRSMKEKLDAKISPVPFSGCHLFVGKSLQKEGYGLIKQEGIVKLAHRISYELNVGPIPEGMIVCHKCDVPPCVNPDHLFIGTKKDNSDDMIRKNRAYHPSGAKAPNARLSAEQVDKIRNHKSPDISYKEIAKSLGVNVSTVHRIAAYKTWKDQP